MYVRIFCVAPSTRNAIVSYDRSITYALKITKTSGFPISRRLLKISHTEAKALSWLRTNQLFAG